MWNVVVKRGSFATRAQAAAYAAHVQRRYDPDMVIEVRVEPSAKSVRAARRARA